MNTDTIWKLITGTGLASLGFLNENNIPEIRKVLCTWHKGMNVHYISTNVSSRHVQALLKNNNACLYFENCDEFQGLCLTGNVIIHLDHEYKALLWHDTDTQYYPLGVDDPDYCVLEFVAESGRAYCGSGSYDLPKEELRTEKYGTKPVEIC